MAKNLQLMALNQSFRVFNCFRNCRKIFLFLILLIFLTDITAWSRETSTNYDLTEMTIEDLLTIEITTTVSRKAQPLATVPVAACTALGYSRREFYDMKFYDTDSRFSKTS